MTTKINVLQVIPKLGYGELKQVVMILLIFLAEKDCGSFIATSGGRISSNL